MSMKPMSPKATNTVGGSDPGSSNSAREGGGGSGRVREGGEKPTAFFGLFSEKIEKS